MVYSKDKIKPILCGYLQEDKEVLIKLIDIKNDKEIPLKDNDNKCIESEIQPGLYYFKTDNIKDSFFMENNDKEIEIAYIMYLSIDDSYKYGGKIVISNDYRNLKSELEYIQEQIKIVKNISKSIPDEVINYDISLGKNDDDEEIIMKLQEILINIKRNADMILAS